MPRLFTSAIIIFFPLIFIAASFAQPPGPRDDPMVIEIIRLDYAEAEHLARVLAPFLSPQGRIAAYGPANSLIIKDRKSIVQELVKAIKGQSKLNPD